MAQNIIKSATDQREFVIVYKDFLNDSKLDKNEKLIFIALKSFADNKTMKAFPSHKRLSEMTGISVAQIKRGIDHMEKMGILSVRSRNDKKYGRRSNVYTLYDYREIWAVPDEQDDKEVAEKISDAKMIAILRAKGYTITKEKGLKSGTDQSTDLKPNSNCYVHSNNYKDSDSKSQAIELYPLDDIKELIGYDALLDQMPGSEKDIDSFFNLIYDTINTTRPYIKISGTDKPVDVVRGRLLKLNYEHIGYAITKYNEQTGRINNPTAYKLKLLYDAYDQMHSDITNQVQHDFYGDDGSDPE